MRYISEQEIKALSPTGKSGGKVRAPQLYKELEEMQIGSVKFISREEWKSYGYKGSFGSFVKTIQSPLRKGGRTKLAEMETEITLYKEGWVIKRVA